MVDTIDDIDTTGDDIVGNISENIVGDTEDTVEDVMGDIMDDTEDTVKDIVGDTVEDILRDILVGRRDEVTV